MEEATISSDRTRGGYTENHKPRQKDGVVCTNIGRFASCIHCTGRMRRFSMLLAVVVMAGASEMKVDNSTDTLEDSNLQDDPISCAFQFTPSCLRSLATHVVDKLSSDPHFQLLPGVVVSSDVSSSGHGAGQRAAAFIRSLTLSVQPLHLELPFFNTSKILEGLLNQVTGRRKPGAGAGGLAAIGLMMGGAVMTMVMAGLAAMAGKALMTSLTALMLAGMSALKGNGGGGGTKTVEIVAKPQHGHSSDHGW